MSFAIHTTVKESASHAKAAKLKLLMVHVSKSLRIATNTRLKNNVKYVMKGMLWHLMKTSVYLKLSIASLKVRTLSVSNA